jgi:cellulose synthase/poly-beta-1,6-N-acetylglucosamine synthase-like glycosyltransferase
MQPPTTVASATVIIPAYTLDRWELLSNAVASVEAQTRLPVEIILCIDHNSELLERCMERWGKEVSTAGFPIHVVPNRFEQDEEDAGAHVKAHGSKRRFGAGWARNSGAEQAVGDILVFLDDDAAADPDWLEHLLAPYEDPGTVAVGGAPRPNYETQRPAWFPANFDWVFGCAYEGMPKELAPLGHLIGANMSVRRSAFEEIGGFHSIDFDDLDLCMRVATQRPGQKVLYEPRAVVHHFVPAERVEWRYFWRRCFFVNREKVYAFADMGGAANIRAEREFVRRAMTKQVSREVADVLRGKWIGLLRLGAMQVGVIMAAAGHVVGRAQLALWNRSGATRR